MPIKELQNDAHILQPFWIFWKVHHNVEHFHLIYADEDVLGQNGGF